MLRPHRLPRSPGRANAVAGPASASRREVLCRAVPGSWHDQGVVERIIAACDGASKGNPGPAGWAWVMGDGTGVPVRWEAGPLGTATNNVAELTALERLLTAADPQAPMEIRMDSQYAMKAVTTWLPGWKRKGWKTSAGKPVANQDLVVRIDALLTGRTVEFRYVPAHQVGGDPLNDFADRAASQAAVAQRPAGSGLGSPPPPPSPTSAIRASATAPAAGPVTTSRTASATKTAGPPRTLKAKYPGKCRCGRAYAAGEPITKNDDGWGHPDCR
jgi:ribonuclease HI